MFLLCLSVLLHWLHIWVRNFLLIEYKYKTQVEILLDKIDEKELRFDCISSSLTILLSIWVLKFSMILNPWILTWYYSLWWCILNFVNLFLADIIFRLSISKFLLSTSARREGTSSWRQRTSADWASSLIRCSSISSLNHCQSSSLLRHVNSGCDKSEWICGASGTIFGVWVRRWLLSWVQFVLACV